MLDPAAAFNHLTVARITAEADRTSGAFFHHWATRDEYVADLIGRIVDTGRSDQFGTFERVATERLAAGETVSEALSAGARAGLRSSVADPRVALEMLLWSRAARDETAREELAALNKRLDSANAEVVEQFLALTGRVPRPPFDAVAIAALIGAITQGLTLRKVIDPAVFPDDSIGWILLFLAPMFSAEPGDESSPTALAPKFDVAPDNTP